MWGELRRRLSKLRAEQAKRPATRAGTVYRVDREGAGQVALVGPPNSGKSALVAALTHAAPEVAPYPFTTREPTPGMMAFEDIQFQVVDLPAVSEEHVEPWVFDLVRHADFVWVVLRAAEALEGLEEVNRLLEARNIDIYPYQASAAPPGPIGRVSKRALLVMTGLDEPGAAESVEVVDELLERRWPIAAVSVTAGTGLEALKRRTFDAFGIIRVYTKQPGKPADRGAPFTLPRGSTVGDLALRIHKDILGSMKFARVWGSSAFDGQSVQKDHVLAEGDVVEIHQ
jgi:ribosome-interacting GTPase 1